jgi:prepilin-type N-terminal cleavage/methylation domain-containing protein
MRSRIDFAKKLTTVAAWSPRGIRSTLQRTHSVDVGSTESGFTLVEIMITVAILGVVLAITAPLVTAFYDVNGDVQQSFTATNDLVLASESITQYLHEAVAPCPTGSTKCSTTAFSSASSPTATSLTFYANTGNANGPVEVVITTTGTTMSGVIYNPTAGTCPFNGSLTTGCTYANPSHALVTVPDLTNVTSITSPMFSYDISSGTADCSTTSPTASAIVAVCLNFEAALRGGQPTGYESLAFALASSYNGSVG